MGSFKNEEGQLPCGGGSGACVTLDTLLSLAPPRQQATVSENKEDLKTLNLTGDLIADLRLLNINRILVSSLRKLNFDGSLDFKTNERSGGKRWRATAILETEQSVPLATTQTRARGQYGKVLNQHVQITWPKQEM